MAHELREAKLAVWRLGFQFFQTGKTEFNPPESNDLLSDTEIIGAWETGYKAAQEWANQES